MRLRGDPSCAAGAVAVPPFTLKELLPPLPPIQLDVLVAPTDPPGSPQPKVWAEFRGVPAAPPVPLDAAPPSADMWPDPLRAPVQKILQPPPITVTPLLITAADR